MKLLLCCDDPTRRLGLVGALRDAFEVRSVAEGEDLLRVARSVRPEVVLLVGSVGESTEVLRRCRVLRTDLVPFERVGVVLLGDAPPPVSRVRTALASGYLGGEASLSDERAFVDALARGETVERIALGSGGGVRRWLRQWVGVRR